MLEWKGSAAYLYILHLDRYGLAWEYLRRNEEYREHWQHQAQCPDPAMRWGCATFEHPDRDARDACPQWVIESPDRIHLIPASQEHPSDHPFSLWMLRGSRSLMHLGSHLTLHIQSSFLNTYVCVDPTVEEGKPYAFMVRADQWCRERLRATSVAIEQFFHSHTARSASHVYPLNRTALTHARTLQALDGVYAGASQRDIAAALFGDHRVQSQWTSDGELRAQVRYLIRRGKDWMNGGYRSLLHPVVNRSQGEKSP